MERAAAKAGPSGDIVTMLPPDDLSDDAKALWEAILPDLIKLKVFSVSDAPMLAELCSSLAYARGFRVEMDALTAELGKLGEAGLGTIEEIERYDMLSLTLKRARSGYTQMMRVAMNLASDFAISPVSRLRLGLMKAKGSSLLGILGQKAGDGK